MRKIKIIAFLLLSLVVANSYAARAGADGKGQIRGLIDRQNTSWISQDDGKPLFTMANVNQFPGLFAGVVINTSWQALQPTSANDLDVSTITGPLAQIASYNQQHPDRPLAVKLRVWAGANAPQWAKSLGGAPITIYRNKVGSCTGATTCPLTVGRFWDVNGQYVQAWRSLQQKLAALYDTEPLIRQVAVTSCTQQTDEPFVPTTDATSQNNLHAAGYTDAAQQACLTSAATVDYAPWKSTLVDFSFNPFSPLDTKGQDMAFTEQDMAFTEQDMAFTEQVMDSFIERLGARCILDSQAVGKKGQDTSTPIFAAIKLRAAQGAHVNLQTASPAGMGNDPQQAPDMQIWSNTFTMAHEIGTVGLEVWSEANFGGVDKMSMAQLCSLLDILLPGEGTKPPCASSQKSQQLK